MRMVISVLFQFAVLAELLLALEMPKEVHLQPVIQHVQNIPYYISPSAVASLNGETSKSGPCTILPITDISVTKTYLAKTIARFAQQDDVWTSGYLQTIIFEGTPASAPSSEDVETLLKSWGTKAVYYLEKSPEDRAFYCGPHWLDNAKVHRVSRLYADNADAFVISTVQSDEDDRIYRPLGVAIYGESNPASLSVAVPSRLYYKRSAERPLAGLRIAVKDTMDLHGIRTGGSSRSYTRLYGPRNKTAPAVERLLDLGAIVVGKTKTTQFADTEWATVDWIDFHAPFTPRADGYQSPSGSSAGSGAAMAAYDWLDFATGTDGCGSLRSPAAIEGLFSMRPSHGSISIDGIIPWGSSFDTFGGLARDAQLFNTISELLYGSPEFQSPKNRPKRILLPTDFWPVAHEESQAAFEVFVTNLESYLGVNRTTISMTELWKKTNPVGTNKSIEEYFHNTLPYAYAPTQWETYAGFQEDYIQKFGDAPYFNPEGQFKMQWLPTITPDMHSQGLRELSVFKKWFEENIIPASEDGSSEGLLLLPWTTGSPDYRDTYRNKPEWAGYGWFYYMIAPFAQSPEMILPISQTPYVSKVTKQQEWLPVSIGIVSAKGSDAALSGFLVDLIQNTAMQTTMQVGKTAFPVEHMKGFEGPPSQHPIIPKI